MVPNPPSMLGHYVSGLYPPSPLPHPNPPWGPCLLFTLFRRFIDKTKTDVKFSFLCLFEFEFSFFETVEVLGPVYMEWGTPV